MTFVMYFFGYFMLGSFILGFMNIINKDKWTPVASVTFLFFYPFILVGVGGMLLGEYIKNIWMNNK